MFWFCWHKWGEIKDGYQYCKKCGIAIPVPCNHKWETICESNILTAVPGGHNITGKMYAQKCKICGEIKKMKVELYDK